MRDITAIDVVGVITCSACERTLKRATTGQIDGLVAEALEEGWMVDEDNNILCPDCLQEREYENAKEAEEMRRFEDTERLKASQEVAG
jgi:hypothetical protein